MNKRTNRRTIAGFAMALATPAALAQFSPIVDAERLGGVEGFVAYGPAGSHAGRWVAPAGDVNADGIDDMAVGAFQASYSAADGTRVHGGAGYVVFGRTDNDFPRDMSAMRLDQGFTVHYSRQGRRYVARSIGAAGDFNGDGIDDIVVTAGDPSYYTAFPDDLVAAVIFGRADGWPALIDLAELRPEEGVLITAGNQRTWSETAVAAAAGDINNDGVDDIIIGSPHADGGIGRAHVLFGSATGSPARIDLQSLDGTNGFAILGYRFVDTWYEGNTGTSVAAAGDVNGDGVDDIMIGSPGAPGGTFFLGYGMAHVVFGRPDGRFPPVVELARLGAEAGFEFKSVQRNPGPRGLGSSVAGVGDVNLDGIDDLAVSAATQSQGYPPTVYVLYGRRQFPRAFGHEDLDATTAAVIEDPHRVGSHGSLGYSISSAGDLNDDGVPDILIGSPPYASHGLPRTHVVFGGDLPARVRIEDLDGRNGFTMFSQRQNDLGGYSVAGVGDLNADGIDDVAMGARRSRHDDREAGASHVLFGGGYCRVDINGDGVLDAFDVLQFFRDFEAFYPRYTDWNRDGQKDAADFQAFLTDFAAGCP